MASARGLKAGRAFVEIAVFDRVSAGLRRAQRKLRAFGRGVRRIGVRLSAVGSSLTGAFALAVRSFAKTGDVLDKMSKRTGISVEALSELGFAAEQSGSNIETLENGVCAMQRSINDLGRGLSTQVDAFGALGLTFNRLRGFSPEAQFKLIAQRISEIEDPSKRAAVALQIFGRKSTLLLPLMKDGARGIEALQAEARRLGLTLSTQTAQDAVRLTEALNIMRTVLRVTVKTIGAALAPAIEELAMRVTRVAIIINMWIKNNRELIVTSAKIAVGISLLGSAFLALSILLGLTATAFAGLAAIATATSIVLSAIGSAFVFLFSPLGLIIANIVLLGVAMLKATGIGSKVLKFLGDKFKTLKDIAGKAFGGIRDALAAGDINLAAKILWNGIKLIFLEGVKEIREKFASGILIVKTTFNSILADMSKAWVRFTAGIKKPWEKTQNFLAKGFTRLFGVFDKSLDVKAANEQLDKQSKAKIKALGKKTKDAIDRINKEENDKFNALINEGAAETDKRKSELEEARKKLEEAIEEAKRKRLEAEAKDKTAPEPPDTFNDQEDTFDNVDEMIKKQIETRGTFNALAVQGLLAGGNAINRTAEATEKTAINTKRIKEAILFEGPTFA